MASASKRRGSPFLLRTSLLAFRLLLPATEASSQETEVRTAIKTTLPGYDPTIRQRSTADQQKAEAKAEAPPAVPQAERPTVASNGGIGQEPVKLSPFTVYANRVKPAAPSPVARPAIEAPVNDVEIDPFLTPKGRDALLAKKYLTSLDRDVLNRWNIPLVGLSKETRARNTDKTHQAAVAQGELANAVDALGRVAPESKEYQELKEIYQQIEYSRPRE